MKEAEGLVAVLRRAPVENVAVAGAELVTGTVEIPPDARHLSVVPRMAFPEKRACAAFGDIWKEDVPPAQRWVAVKQLVHLAQLCDGAEARHVCSTCIGFWRGVQSERTIDQLKERLVELGIMATEALSLASLKAWLTADRERGRQAPTARCTMRPSR